MSQQAAIDLNEHAQAQAPVSKEPALLVMPAPRPGEYADGALSLESHTPDSLEATESRLRRLLAVADVLAMAGSLLAILNHFGVDLGVLVAIASIPAVLFLFKITGLYNRDELRLDHSTLDEAPILLQLTALFALGVAILHPSFPAGVLSRGEIALYWGVSFVAVVSGRVLVRALGRRILPAERCLLIGEGPQADRVRDRIAASRARSLIVDSLGDREVNGIDSAEMILDLVRKQGIDRIIIAPVSTGTDGVVELIRMAKAVGVRVSVLPRILEVVGSAVVFDEVEGMAMLGVPRFGLCRTSRWLKRGLDLVAAAIGLVLISPLLALIAAAIKLDSRGPIFFRQIRVGRNGEHFYMVKFRSMVADAEARKAQLRSLNVAGEGLFKVKDDPRITRVGRLLRSSSLDELPQIFNVLRGEMSLVGPRPLVTDEDAQVLGLDRSRLRLKPGMTGPWQLLGSRVPLQEMVEIDYLYASHWSLWLDCKILFRTVRHVARRGNL